MNLLPRLPIQELLHRPRLALDPVAMELAQEVDTEIQRRGAEALREYAERWDGLQAGDALVLERSDLERSLDELEADTRALLERSARRIQDFARAQLACVRPLDIEIEGGQAGHRLQALRRAGCYAPGGRYPLPSSVLMTVLPARVAGVEEIVVASPKPDRILRAAAAIAGADRLLRVGGAQAISALAHGVGGVETCDIIVGPGNAYVTAAKHIASRITKIDMLAGPSELLIVASEDRDARVIAADLLAQAEHDDQALPMLITDRASLLDAVEFELKSQLQDLETAPTARNALRNGGAILVQDLDAAIRVANQLAPEHLQLLGAQVEGRAEEFHGYGALFVGRAAGEVLGDYGAGPNHVLPTGSTAVQRGGLSVLDFLALRTWIRLEDGAPSAALVQDAQALARLEGLSGHARAAGLRSGARST